MMGKVLMVFASMSGNTEIITDIIADNLKEIGHEVVIKSFDFDVIDMETLLAYDAVLVGMYTWDGGELPYEAEDFYIDLETIDITNTIFGVYGSADSFYDTFGLAIELMADQIKNLGGQILPERLKIDLEPTKADMPLIAEFSRKISEMIAAKNGALM